MEYFDFNLINLIKTNLEGRKQQHYLHCWKISKLAHNFTQFRIMRKR